MTTTKYPLTIRVYLKQPEGLIDENRLKINFNTIYNRDIPYGYGYKKVFNCRKIKRSIDFGNCFF